MIDGAGNVCVSRRCFEEMAAPHFDPAFALTGGEDREFFTRLKRAGKRFAWADEAVCHEHVPASRASLGWALSRAYRIGNSDMRVFLKFAPARGERLRERRKIAGDALYPLLQLAGAACTSRGSRSASFRASGKIAAPVRPLLRRICSRTWPLTA